MFERPARRGGLTDAGKALVEYAKRLITVRHQARLALEDVRAMRAGRLAMHVTARQCLCGVQVVRQIKRRNLAAVSRLRDLGTHAE